MSGIFRSANVLAIEKKKSWREEIKKLNSWVDPKYTSLNLSKCPYSLGLFWKALELYLLYFKKRKQKSFHNKKERGFFFSNRDGGVMECHSKIIHDSETS